MTGIIRASSPASTNLMAVNRQWMSRPDDERFLTIEALYDDAKGSHDRATAEVLDINQGHYRVVTHGDEGLLVETADGLLVPTHHAFQQLAGEANAPAQFLRELHPEMAAMNLNYCLHANGNRQAVQFLHETPREAVEGDPFRILRAITSPGYGRVWDYEVVQALMDWNNRSGGKWKVPYATYQDRDPLLATTLYRGDRTMFAFLVNEDQKIEIGKTRNGQPDVLSRGVIVFNSEVRESLLGVLFFLYRYVCDNRIVWDAQNIQFVGIRHTSRAPERWREQIIPVLDSFAGTSAKNEIERIRKAKSTIVGKTDEEVSTWLLEAGFGARQAAEVIEFARREEGDARTAWQLLNGATARARSTPYAQERTDRERAASSILDRIAA